MEISASAGSASNILPGQNKGRLSNHKLASQSLSLYGNPPFEEITIDEFEKYALDRLQLLRKIEQAVARDGGNAEALKKKIQSLINEHMPLRQSIQDFDTDKRKDSISHFILRLAYSQTGDLRRWFILHECILMKHRLAQLTPEQRSSFMHTNGIDYEQLPDDEKNAKREQLVGLTKIVETNFASTIYYRVPFKAALPLVARRDVYLERGYAYVPFTEVVSLIIQRFRMNLSKALAEASTMFDYVSTDSRIGPLIKNMNKMYVGKDFTKGTGNAFDKLTPDQVNDAADNNMPLCMKNLHNGLKKDNKLKHWGRLQYGLFLKGAGLSVEDAMQFFGTHFNKIMSNDDFTKKYAYTIRHMYGKEGARKDYTPYSCMKIILGSPPEVGAYHGCPYKHSSDTQLLSQLQGLKIGGPDVKEIVDTARRGDFQLACQKHFDATHPTHRQHAIKGAENAANHPNQWFQASAEYHRILTTGKSSSTSSSSSSSSQSQSQSQSSLSSPMVRSHLSMNSPGLNGSDMEASAEDIAEAEAIMRATNGDM